MENQALISLKDKSKKLKCCLLQFLFGALRVKLTQIGCLVVTDVLDAQNLLNLVPFYFTCL